MSNELTRRMCNLQDAFVAGDIDAAAYERGLSRLRAVYGAAQVDACLDALPHEAPATPHVTVTIATESGTISGSPVHIIGHAEQVTLPDPTRERATMALLTYLRHVVGECATLPLGALDRTDADHRPVELARVYVSLHTTDRVAPEVSLPDSAHRWKEDSRPMTALEALAQAPGQRLMLLGTPGSGKSTFVSHAALCLAGASLCLRNPAEAAPDGGWMMRLPGWNRGALLPVRVLLRDLAAAQSTATPQRGSVRLLETFLATMLADAGCADAFEPLVMALRDGSALLLLDGLDEVIGDAILERVVASIADAAHSYRAPILVTCRAFDYQEEPKRHLAGFATRMLAELDDEQIAQFVQDWYVGLAASGRRTLGQAIERAVALQQAIEARDELRALARSPLVLTVMALVHIFRGHLPDSRAQLYSECVDLLLLRWRQPTTGPDLLRQLNLSDLRESDLRAMLARLGFEAHRKAERLPGDRSAADLSEAEVIGVLAEEFARYQASRKHALAEVVVQALTHGNGLLHKRGPDVYAFLHRSFQEFLAGQHLKGQQYEYLRRCCELSPYLHWHEALTLMVGVQVLEDREIERPLLLIDRLLDRSSQEQALAGELLALVGHERAERYSAEEAQRIWRKATQVLRALVTTALPAEASATLRSRVGLALGRLCYGDMKDLMLPDAHPVEPDPRLPFAVLGTVFQEQTDWAQTLQGYWCRIEPGPFWSGDDRKGRLTRATITAPYRIARYVVTNADFARFLAANGPDGYDPSQPWWGAQGRMYVLPGGFRFTDEPERITQPRFWLVSRYNGTLQPVVGVSWYEAAAYCRWLTLRGHTEGWLPYDEIIRLPTWYEWERAARHRDRRQFPWGDDPLDPEWANYQETEIRAGAAIGCFPAGVAECGAQDMVGNVWEWTASPWSRWDQWRGDFMNEDRVAMSRTNCSDPADVLGCGARDWFFPFDTDAFWGFRVVQSRTRGG